MAKACLVHAQVEDCRGISGDRLKFNVVFRFVLVLPSGSYELLLLQAHAFLTLYCCCRRVKSGLAETVVE